MREQDHVWTLPRMQHTVRQETSLPHERPAIRASMIQTWTSGSCQSSVRKRGISLQPAMWSPNSSTERTGSCTLRSHVDSLWQTGHSLTRYHWGLFDEESTFHTGLKDVV